MFWIGLATLIMIISGSGDDTLAFRQGSQLMKETIAEQITDAQRRKEALAAVDEASRAFAAHRQRLDKVGKCIEKVDRTYNVTREDYLACSKNTKANWEKARAEYILAQDHLRKALTEDEWHSIRKSVTSKATQ